MCSCNRCLVAAVTSALASTRASRRLGRAVNTPHLSRSMFLVVEFEAGVKVVLQLPVSTPDQGVDRFHHFGIVMPLVSKGLPHMGPVFLLHPGIVVFLYGLPVS